MKYIEREELLNNLKQFAPEHLTPLIINLIQKQPAADVVPVVHGKWEYIGTDKMGNVFRCSNCASRMGLDKETDYCPHCGAKMDGKDGEQ